MLIHWPHRDKLLVNRRRSKRRTELLLLLLFSVRKKKGRVTKGSAGKKIPSTRLRTRLQSYFSSLREHLPFVNGARRALGGDGGGRGPPLRGAVRTVSGRYLARGLRLPAGAALRRVPRGR